MAERSSLKPAPASFASLTPQGQQAGKPPMHLGRPFTLIGSRNRSHLHLLSSSISRNHACIITTDNGLYLRDLASRTGVTVNGRRVKEVDLRDGDVVGIGSFKFKFTDPAGPVRFPITPKPEPAMLEIDGSTLTPLDTRTLLIGRRPNCDVPLTEESVSNSHAIIFEANGQRFIRDLGSRTGTLVNGKPVHHELLEFGDRIRIGETDFRYVAAEPQEQPEAARAEEHEHDLEPIGLHFTDEPESASSHNGEAHAEPEPMPLADEHEAPISEAADTVGHEELLPIEPELEQHATEFPAQEEFTEAPTEQALTTPLDASAHDEELGLDFWAEEPAGQTAEEAPIGVDEPAAAPEPPATTEQPAAELDIPLAEPSAESHAIEPHELTGHFGDLPSEPQTVTEPEAPIDLAPIADSTEPAAESVADDVASGPFLEPESATPDRGMVEPEEIPFVDEVSVPQPQPAESSPEAVAHPVEEAPPEIEPEQGGRKRGGKKGSRRRSSKKASTEAPVSGESESPAIPLESPAAEEALHQTITPAFDTEATVTGDVADVVETTEPTPESAQSLEPVLPVSEAAEAVSSEPPPETPQTPDALTDTAFGRAVQEFAGPELGPLVEETMPPESSHAPMTEHVDTEEPQDQLEAAAESLEPEWRTPEPVELAEAPTTHPIEPAEPIGTPVFEEHAPAADLPEFSAPAEGESDPLAGIPELTTALGETAELDWEEPTDPAAAELSLEHPRFEEPAPVQPVEREPEPEEIPDVDFVSTESLPAAEPEHTNASEPPPPVSRMEPAAPPGAVPPPPPAAVDPFFGMSRDLGSFMGGMPLPLASNTASPPQPEPPAPPEWAPNTRITEPEQSRRASNFTAPVDQPDANIQSTGLPGGDDDEPTITFNDPDELPPIDESLLADPEPLELFDDNAEKLDALPDTLEPIGDLGSVVGEPASNPAAPKTPPAPPRPASKAPPPPPQPISKAAPPAAKPKAATPPRPTGLRSLTGQPTGPAPAPFAPAPPPGGLQGNPPARPPVRATDVFSQTTFPGSRDPIFGAAPLEIPEIPPIGRRPGPAAPQRPAPAAQQAADPAKLRREAIPPNRQGAKRQAAGPAGPASAAAPSANVPPVATAAARAKRPWYKRFGVLLSLMIVAIILVILAVLWLPQHHLLQGTLQLQGLEKVDALSRRPIIAEIRKSLDDPQVRTVALANLASQNVAPGFVQDPAAMDQLAMPQNSPFDEARGALVLTRSSTDLPGDRARMKAVLAALYAESGKNNDMAAIAHQKLERTQAALHEIETQNAAQDARVAKLSDQIRTAGGPMTDLLLQNPSANLLQLEQQDGQLHLSLNKADDLINRRREALQQAQAAAKPDPVRAAQIQQIQHTIADLTSRLQAARLAQSGKTDQAAKAFETSLATFDEQLAALPPSPTNPKVAAFIAQASDLSDQIHQLDSRLVVRQQEDTEAVSQLRRQLADRREAHLRQVWSADDGLKQMLEERNAQAHRYSAAIDSGYSDEATRIKGVLDNLDQKIDARRNALATGGQYADDLQQKLQQTIGRMEQSRQHDEQQMAEKLKTLEAAVPAADAVPASQQPALAKLTATVASMGSARRTYAAAAALSSADADVQARQLQTRLAEQQARLDALSSAASSDHPQASVEAARRALDAAQEQAATASSAYISNHNLLAAVRDLADARTHSSELADSLKAARDEVEQRKADAAKFPVIQQPDDNSVAVIYGKDERIPYLIAGVALTVIFFGIPLWMSVREPRQPAPYASFADGSEIIGHPAEAYGNVNDFDPDEHPAAV